MLLEALRQLQMLFRLAHALGGKRVVQTNGDVERAPIADVDDFGAHGASESSASPTWMGLRTAAQSVVGGLGDAEPFSNGRGSLPRVHVRQSPLE